MDYKAKYEAAKLKIAEQDETIKKLNKLVALQEQSIEELEKTVDLKDKALAATDDIIRIRE